MVKSELSASYEIKDIGEAKLILGICIKRNKTTDDIILLQQTYSKKMLEWLNMTQCKPTFTPLLPEITLTIDDCLNSPEEAEKMKAISYHEAFESLIWL